MPTSIGHALAGAAAAWAADLVPGRRAWRTAPRTASWYRRAGNGLTFACLVLGVIPDADLLFRTHRTYSHSVAAAVVAGLVAAAIAAARGRPVARVGVMCAAAYATHLLLDWLAVDLWPPVGIQLFWPFSQRFYLAGWNVFRQIERAHLISARTIRIDALAVAQELAVLAPIVMAIWLVRVKALAGLPAEMSRRDHPAE